MTLRVLFLLLPLTVGAQDAVDGLLRAWDRHPLIAVGEVHPAVEDKEFLLKLIGRPEFPRKVRDIAIEFGNAKFQPVLDRYIVGQTVSLEELRSIWSDTTAVNGVWNAPIYERFLTAVRERNRSLPNRRKLRVLACDPPIDWTAVKTLADAAPHLARDPFCASLLEREVLARRRRALVIMGDAHVSRRHFNGRLLDNTVTRVEAKHRGSVFVVLTWVGQYKDGAEIERRIGESPVPSLTLLQGTWLGGLPAAPPQPRTRTRVGGGQKKSETVVVTNPPRLDETADALLYLGPKSGFSRSVPSPDQFPPARMEELARRHQLLFGLPLDRGALFQ